MVGGGEGSGVSSSSSSQGGEYHYITTGGVFAGVCLCVCVREREREVERERDSLALVFRGVVVVDLECLIDINWVFSVYTRPQALCLRRNKARVYRGCSSMMTHGAGERRYVTHIVV